MILKLSLKVLTITIYVTYPFSLPEQHDAHLPTRNNNEIDTTNNKNNIINTNKK